MSETRSTPDEAPPAAAPTAARRTDWHGILAVVLLSAIAVVTAWCGFESSKWSGAMSISFSQASSARVQATDASSGARDQKSYDLTVYAQWVVATANGQTDLADYIAERFPPSLAVAFDAWDKTDASPFALPEYVLPGDATAKELNAKADAAYAQALANNQRGDNFALLTVLFALVLFLTAVAQRQDAAWAQRTMLYVGVVVAIVGVSIMLTYPILI